MALHKAILRNYLVGMERFELSRVAPYDSESYAYTVPPHARAPSRIGEYAISPSTKLLPSQKFVWAGLAVLRARKTSLRLSSPVRK